MGNPAWVANNRRARYNMMPDIGSWKPAFKLTQEEARDLVVTYVLNGLLTLEKPVTFGADGAPTYPKVGDKPRLKLDSIGGVAWVADQAVAANWKTTHPMDMRTAVLAVRLARFLREQSRWGVSTIYWGGMGVGRDENDRHGQGFAIDFHGAISRVGKFNVQADWGSQPITLPNGNKMANWPLGVAPYYRLDVDTNAGGFFYAVYHFLTGEASDNGSNNPSAIGGRSQILCPDMPDPALRPYHSNHIHCEVDR
jgi:hypothetical protein